MQTIELECPSCETLLELDAGFAGGVCRCSNCGTLMTVPQDPQSESPEKLRRPERPDMPERAERPESGDAGSGISPSPQSQEPAAQADDAGGGSPAPSPQIQTPQSRAERRAAAEVAPSGSGSGLASHATATYVTPSGRTVRISRSRKVPTAQRRRRRVMVRGITAASVVTGTILLLGLMVYGLTILIGTAGPDHPDDATDYRPRTNPFLTDRATFFDIPIDDATVLAVQAGGPVLPRSGIEQLQALTEHVTSNFPAETRFAVVYFGARIMDTFPPDGMEAWGDDHTTRLAEFHRQLGYDGGIGQPVAALEAAIDLEPRAIILVMGQSISDEERSDIADMLDQHTNLTVHVVHFVREDTDLRELIEQHGGVVRRLNTTELADWYDEARADD